MSPKTSTAEAGVSGNRQLTVTIDPENATNQNVTFSITETEGLTVSENGCIEWTEDTQAGNYTTTATTEDGEFTDTHVLTLNEPEGSEG